jgi:hypothetical protein
MVAARSGAKKFLVGTALGVVVTTAVDAVTTGSFEVLAASFLECLFRFRTSWKPSSLGGFFRTLLGATVSRFGGAALQY